MLGNQAFATAIGFVPVMGDIAIAAFKTNSRNSALLEEYLRIRGEEFLKAQTDRVEDPEVVKPGAGIEKSEKIPEKAPPRSRLSLFGRSSKKVPTEDTLVEGNDKPKEEDKARYKGASKSNRKGKGKEKGE